MKKRLLRGGALLTASALLLCLLAACGPKAEVQTFAQAHDAFQTKLTVQNSDDDPVPQPPEGMFDLVKYPSKVGDLAAYVSSDPGDGQKHPLIIWVVGGWGNGIDEFPWSYAPWDDDQTGSAFWEAGVLTMYPSFRGGNGNPGYYEALFGEVDDIVSAYEYAASLPYVDPQRIYLGGHSTGATRALLAAEYTDQFRAVFCFGAVDEIKYHNNSQFTFDTSSEEEFIMRSPIHWLENIQTPTFLIEGEDGNSDSLRSIQKKSTNENIHCYIMDGADHFSVLAPLTELVAQKILQDTGAQVGITLSQEELESAMDQPPKEPMPLMTRYQNDALGVSFSHPISWPVEDLSDSEGFLLFLQSEGMEDNVWDMSSLYVEVFTPEEADYLQQMGDYLANQGFEVGETSVGGLPAITAQGSVQNDNGSVFTNHFLLVDKAGTLVQLDFYIHESYGDAADGLYQAIADSLTLA